MKVIVAHRDPTRCQQLMSGLDAVGIEATTATLGTELLSRVASEPFDLVLLDVSLPDMNGFDVLERIQMTNDLAVIMLTDRSDDAQGPRALNLGADDYLSRPLDMEDVVARVKAVIRRTQKSRQMEVVEADDAVLYPARREVRIGSETIVLTGVESQILARLMRRAGQTLTRDHLYRTVLNRPPMPFDRSLDTHISNLRRKLGKNSRGAARIMSVRGIGYLFTD